MIILQLAQRYLSSPCFNFRSALSRQIQMQDCKWTLRFMKDGKEAFIKKMPFVELAKCLENLARSSKKQSEHGDLDQIVSGLTVSERQSIRFQVMAFKIPVSGGVFELDPAISVTRTSYASIIPTVKQPRKIHCTGQVETDTLRWLKDQKGCIVLRDIKHRHQFTLDFGGLLTSSQFSSVHLMEAWQADLQSKPADIRPCIAKTVLADCRLVCVKIAKCAEGRRRLQREGAALQALQDTGRVAELWNPGEVSKYLDRGVLITLYQPVPPPQDSGIDIFLSRVELEAKVEELTRVLAMLHKSSWIWLGLKPSHILFHLQRMDPRDSVPPLRIIGLENARCLADTHCSVDVADSIWCAPEVKAQQQKHRNNSKMSSAQTADADSDLTPAVDMYCLGLLITAHLARCPRPVHASGDELCSRFNNPVCDLSQHIRKDHWLVSLASDLLNKDPRLRPTAEQVLQRISSGRRDSNQLQPEMLEPSNFLVDGYIHPETLQMVWPVVLRTIITADQRDASRLTDYVTVHAGIAIPSGKVVADYKGRLVTKEYLQWLRHLKLQSHALNDGDRGAYDARRKCNGIFDMAFYKHFRLVRATQDIFHFKEKNQERMESSVV